MQKDIQSFFNSSGQPDYLFTEEMNSFLIENKGSVAIHWLKKYRDGFYSTEFKNILFAYIHTTLTNPELTTSNPKIIELGPKIIYYHFEDVFHALEELSRHNTITTVFLPLIRHIAKKVRLAKFEDSTNIIAVFKRIVLCGEVFTIFKDFSAWKSETIANENNQSTFFDLLGLERKSIKKIVPPLIDSFFEPFIYDPTSTYCTYTHQNTELRELVHKYNSIIKRNNEIIYEAVLFLLKKDTLIKSHFIEYLRNKYILNKDKMKTIYEKSNIISDGAAINFNYFLYLLSKGIITKNIKDFDLSWFVNEEYTFNKKESDETQKNTYKESSLDINEDVESLKLERESDKTLKNITKESSLAINEAVDRLKLEVNTTFNLQTAVFFTKIIFLNYSYNRLMETMRDTELRINYTDNPTIKAALGSFITAYRIVLFSEVLKEEKRFFTFFSEYLEENEKNEKIPDVLFQCYFSATEFVGRIYGENVISKQLIQNFIFTKLDLIKTVYNNFIDLPLNTLVKLFVNLENKESHTKNELRYCLTQIIVNKGSIDNLDVSDIETVRFYSYIMSDLENGLSKLISNVLEIKRLIKEKGEDDFDTKRVQKELEFRHTTLLESFNLIDIINLEIYLENNLIGQFISVINHNLKILIGPNCNELNVKEIKTQLDFKDILRKVLKIYIRLSESATFVKALLEDRINFNISLLKKSVSISESKHILNKQELTKLNSLLDKLNKTIIETIKEDEIVPEEFVDPVTCVMMTNPVILNGSKVTIDKSTYDMLYISQMNDPFDRNELSGFVEDIEMRNKIEEFKKSKISK